MIDTIGGKVVMVSNQETALDFYVNKLGLQKKVDMEFGPMRWIEVSPQNSESSISLMEPSTKIMPAEAAEMAKRTIGWVGLLQYQEIRLQRERLVTIRQVTGQVLFMFSSTMERNGTRRKNSLLMEQVITGRNLVSMSQYQQIAIRFW